MSAEPEDEWIPPIPAHAEQIDDPRLFYPPGTPGWLKHHAPKDLLGRQRVDGLRNAGQAKGVNPKDKIGASKVDMTLLPTSAKIEQALAHMDGATKYGPYNWRVEPVELMTYLGAAERHLDCFKEGEERAQDSMVHHLGHVMACCAIMIDAIQQGSYVDNRPVNGKGAEQIAKANDFIKNDKPEGWGR